MLLLLGLFRVSPAVADRDESALKGLKAVVFRVHSYGSKSQPVLRDVEGNLRGAGLRLLSDDEANRQVARLNLDLTVACNGPSCGYAVRLELTERVRLARRPDIESTATTWADGYQDGISESNLSGLMELYDAQSRSLVKSFVDDYRTANPRSR